MRSVTAQQTQPESTARSRNPTRSNVVSLCRLLATVTLSALLAACSSASISAPASGRSDYQLRYSLGSDSSLLVSSPDLNQRLAEQRRQQSLLNFTSSRARAEETTEFPDNLKIELSTPKQSQQSKLMLHFADQGRFLDRASLDSNLRLNNWLLGFNANLAPNPEDTAGRSFHLQSEFSGLLGMRQAPAPPSTRVTASPFAAPGTERRPVPSGASGQTPQSFGLTSPASKLSLDPFVSAPKRYYLAFHDASLGADEQGTLNFLFSFGGYPAEDYGEVVTTYRLLSMNETSQNPQAEHGGIEQAVAISYTGRFSSWIKSFGHTLSYFNYHGPELETPESPAAGLETADLETNYQKWQSRVELSCGEDLRWPLQGFLKGFRLDTHLETQAALERSGLLPAVSHPTTTDWGSQLRLKTDFGTLSGKVSRSAHQHRLAFSLQKSGLAGGHLKLYYEDIDHRGLGELETKIGGQLKLTLDDSLLKILTLAYWKQPEANLFAAQPTKGYTAPRQGQHVPILNNVTPGILQ